MSTMKQLVVADELESFGENNNKNSTILKGLIGNTQCKWESKGVNAMTISNYASYVFLSNNDTPVLIESNDRHYTLCALNEAHREDRDYFNALVSQLNMECAGHFYKYLLELDLSEFDYRSPYMTQSKQEAMEENKHKVIKFVSYLKESNTLQDYEDINDFHRRYMEHSNDSYTTTKKISSLLKKEFGWISTTYKRKINNVWTSSRKYNFSLQEQPGASSNP